MDDTKSRTEKDYLKERARILEQAAIRAERRARSSRWDLNILVFLFAVLIIILILLFEDVEVEIVAPIAFFGLAMVWYVGWKQGKQLYQRFYDEELSRLSQYEHFYNEELSRLSRDEKDYGSGHKKDLL